MSAACCEHDHHGHGQDHGPGPDTPAYRRVLWVALAINLLMFGVEVVAGIGAQSVSLLADALDFLGDAANYGVSLFVLGLALKWRARAALLKSASMAAFGLWVMFTTGQHMLAGTVPDAPTMGAIGVLALLANLAVAGLLWRFREGDSNMESVWLCTRNDAIGNVAVMIAAAGVFGSGTGWPDFVVGGLMAGLALTAAWRVLRRALAELRSPPAVLHAAE
jgi:cation diffusion facilitator family transporter